MTRMRTMLLAATVACLPAAAMADKSKIAFTRLWTYDHSATADQVSEIPAFDRKTNTLWVAGVVGVDILDAETGTLVEHIDTTAYGSVNSVAIHNGLAAFAVESASRTQPGVVLFYDTRARAPAEGTSTVSVGALPDMLTFTHDGSKLLVANEGTPDTYGARLGMTVPFVFASPANDPVGSVSIIDVATRTVVATPTFDGVPVGGSHLRTTTGMDFEPEYIAVDEDDETAFVALQEANAMAVLDLETNSFTRVVGLGAKDFRRPSNWIDPSDKDGTIAFRSVDARGLFMPDAVASYRWRGRDFVVMANEGDFREDDGDRSAAGTFGAVAPLDRLQISNTDSSPGDLYVAGGRSFSIRDEYGTVVYDSGNVLDREAHARGLYNDGRSRAKGVEPEGVALLDVAGRTYAFVGLERTTKSAIAVFDISNPREVEFIDMLVTEGDVSPEGLAAYHYRGNFYLAIANEVSNTTTLYAIERGLPPGRR